MNITYIEFMHPGTFFGESTCRPVPSRELPETIPGRATGYRFYSRQESEVDGEKLVGKPRDYSGWTYFGTEYSAEQVQAMEGDRYRILRDNARINGYTRLVQTTYGNWYPLADEDRVVPDVQAEES